MNLISKILYKAVKKEPSHKFKEFSCGCISVDNIMVELCKTDRRCYICCSYYPPKGHYLMEGIEL